jgi:hypothetical protein
MRYTRRMTWVADHIFAAGGDFVVESWMEFQAQTGLSAVVTVSAQTPGLFSDPVPWAWLWLPLPDEAAYTLAHLDLGVSFIERALQAGQSVLLHGPKGLPRTRPLFAAHLLASGRSLKRVLREVEQRPWLPPYHGDPALLEAFASARAEAR